MTKEERSEKFKLKAVKVHKGYYLYDKIDYVNSTTKICIICPLHGEFWQEPASHLRGETCPKCANKRRGDALRGNREEFIERARETHGDRYDYSKVVYETMMKPVEIICPEHGSFWQIPMQHVKGQGCPKCAGRYRTNDEAIEKMKEAHKDENYDYSKVEFSKMHNKVCIVCHKKDKYGNEHGEFWQTPAKHISGQGCPKCGNERTNKDRKITLEKFKNRGKEIFSSFYNYDKVEFNNLHDKVKIICPTYGEFCQTPESHLKGCGCPTCGKIISKNEQELYEFVCNLVGSDNVIRNDREVLDGKEIDIYIPHLKVGIEYNGVVWHSEQFGKGRDYHIDKLNRAISKGIKLIQIFEDEYIDHKNIVFGKIRHILGFDNYQTKIYARKCDVSEIDRETAFEFLDTNHIQGHSNSTVYLGGYYNGLLIGVMSFKMESKGSFNWELTRFATDITKLCCGVGGKLFKYFVDKYNPKVVKSFADRRWTLDSENNLYTKMGFVLTEILKPEYRYVESGSYERVHKFNFRKERLSKKYGLPLSMTESEMCEQIGAKKVWDCGLLKYVWGKH